MDKHIKKIFDIGGLCVGLGCIIMCLRILLLIFIYGNVIIVIFERNTPILLTEISILLIAFIYLLIKVYEVFIT